MNLSKFGVQKGASSVHEYEPSGLRKDTYILLEHKAAEQWSSLFRCQVIEMAIKHHLGEEEFIGTASTLKQLDENNLFTPKGPLKHLVVGEPHQFIWKQVYKKCHKTSGQWK